MGGADWVGVPIPDDAVATPPAPHDAGAPPPERAVVAFDFAASGRLTRQRARLVQAAMDDVARDATAALRLWVDGLRVKAGNVEQRTVADLLSGVVDHAALALPERAERGLVVTDLALARSLVLTLLGGPAVDDTPPRPLTAIESEVLDLILVRLLACVSAVLDLGPAELGVHQADAAAAASLDEREVMLGLPFELSTTHVTGRVWIVLGAAALQPFTADHERRQANRPASGRPADRRRTEALLQGVTVPVACGFPTVRVPAHELAFLQTGDVVRLGHPTNRDLVVTVGGSPLYAARAGQRGLRLVAEVIAPLAPNTRPLPGGTP